MAWPIDNTGYLKQVKNPRFFLAQFSSGVAILAIGCNQQPVAPVVDDPVVDVAEDDVEIRAAEQEARDRLGDFLEALASGSPDQSSFSIKAPFTDGEQTEFMWISDVTYENDRFTGKLNNEPQTVRGFSLWDKLSVARDEVVDWLYVENGEMKGGFSAKILAQRLRDGDGR